MGHGPSKKIGADESGIRLYCLLDGSMTTSVIVPEEIVDRYCLKFEKWVGLKASNQGVYCCQVEKNGDKIHLTGGWNGFLTAIGATIGDCMLFDIKGADETLVWLYPSGNRQVALPGPATPLTGGQTNGERHKDVAKVVHETSSAINCSRVRGECLVSEETRTLAVNNDLGDAGFGTRTIVKTYVLDEWRTKFVVGRNVVLEDWMIEFVAAGLDWELPSFGIYVGRVEGTSITSNRMRLPRGYTTEHVMPLLVCKQRIFYMDTGRPGGKHLKFTVGSDGRATLTQGWSDFAAANGIRAGTILAFRFSDKQTELDITIDLLQE